MPSIDHLIRTDFRAVDKNDELRNVLGWVSGDVDEPPILTDDGRAIGIVNDRSLMRRRLDWKAKVHNHLTPTRAIEEKADMHEAVKRMLEFRAAYLPVQDAQGRPKGYVRALDLAREMPGELRSAGQMAVKVTPLKPSQTMSEALHVFTNEYVDFLPVLEEDQRVRGVLSRRTLVQLEIGRGHERGRKPAGGEPVEAFVGEVDGFLETATVTVKTDAPREEVFDRLQKFGYAIVVDAEDRFFGIVTPETLFENAVPRI